MKKVVIKGDKCQLWLFFFVLFFCSKLAEFLHMAFLLKNIAQYLLAYAKKKNTFPSGIESLNVTTLCIKL